MNESKLNKKLLHILEQSEVKNCFMIHFSATRLHVEIRKSNVQI